VNKSELIDAIAEKLGGRATAAAAVEAILETVQRSVIAGERVVLSGFGVFEQQKRAARTGRNPSTGARVRIPAMSVPKFRPGTEFKALVSGAKDMAAAKAPAKRVAKKAAKKTTARKAVKKAPAKKAVKRAPAKRVAKKAPAKRVAKKAPAKRAPAKRVAKKAPAKRAAAKRPAKRVAKR